MMACNEYWQKFYCGGMVGLVSKALLSLLQNDVLLGPHEVREPMPYTQYTSRAIWTQLKFKLHRKPTFPSLSIHDILTTLWAKYMDVVRNLELRLHIRLWEDEVKAIDYKWDWNPWTTMWEHSWSNSQSSGATCEGFPNGWIDTRSRCW